MIYIIWSGGVYTKPLGRDSKDNLNLTLLVLPLCLFKYMVKMICTNSLHYMNSLKKRTHKNNSNNNNKNQAAKF